MGDQQEYRYTFTAELWRHEGDAAWTFVTVPVELSEEIRALPRAPRPGFGSIRVTVRLGGSVWSTSVFPDSRSGCYVLPVKKAVRINEALDWGDPATIELDLAL